MSVRFSQYMNLNNGFCLPLRYIDTVFLADKITTIKLMPNLKKKVYYIEFGCLLSNE